MKKPICLLMALMCSLSFAACGGNRGGGKIDNTVEDTKTLKIVALERGYGIEFVYAWAERFEEIYDVTVDVEAVIDNNTISTYQGLGAKYSDYDIFFDIQRNVAMYMSQFNNTEAYAGYEKALMDYTDIYNSKVYGEDITLGEKINPSVKAEMQDVEQDGKYYAVPWASALQAFVVNTKVVTEALGSDYKLPNTTDEFYAFCSAIRSAGYMPLAYPGQLNYWTSAFHTWWAQYEGLDEYYRFYDGKYYDEASDNYIYGAQIYKQQGRLEALKLMEKLLAYESDTDGKSFHLGNVNDYNINNFTTLQKAFVNSNAASSNLKKYAMMPNGDWLAQEAGSANSDPVIMIATPVMSSVINQCATIDTDAELSALIDAIDAKSTALSGEGYDVSQADYDRIAEARNIIFSQASNHIAFSPVYANAKTLIKNFMLFIASDEGIRIYQENTTPGILPFKYNYTSSNAFIQSAVKLYDMAYLPMHENTFLAVNGVKSTTVNNGYYEAVLGVPKSSKSYMSAQQIFESEFWTDNEFMSMLKNIGLVK